METKPHVNGSVGTELWRHPNPTTTRMWKFMQTVNEHNGLNLQTYEELYQWSIKNIASFWEETWDFTGITASKKWNKVNIYTFLYLFALILGDVTHLQVVEDDAPMFPRPDFFEGSRLNFAENLLYPAKLNIDPDSPAIIAATESTRETVSWKELRERVRQCANALRTVNVQPEDRVAGFLGNHTNTVVAMLAAASIGAVWTGVSPDTGVAAVLDRLVQIEPVVLFADNGVEYNGRLHESLSKTREIVKELKGLRKLVVFNTVDLPTDLENMEIENGTASTYDEFLKETSNPSMTLEFTQLPPGHPLYILYSSGTTGKPKCIVHSALGTLIQHKKEHIIHCDIRPQDRLFYFTTCTWMMWHWLVSGLAFGATIILYDGSPFKPHSHLSMPLLIQELKITHFGTSAKYLSILEQNSIFPLKQQPPINLSTLRAIYSTGSPLAPSTFKYIYSAFPPSLNLGSITGGTDIISLFGAPSPLSPVHIGEIQVPGLGMSIHAYSPSGTPLPAGTPGDLVCTAPFPSQPTTFFGPSGNSLYHSSYFSTYFPHQLIWHHGDFVKISPSTGGIYMLGRSDGILKPSGVRFGSAEIYNVLLKHFADEVEDALCIGRRRENDDDETVVLFLKMREGKEGEFGEGLVSRVREVVRRELSPRHVPGVVDRCEEIPVTGNGKKIEVAVKQILCGMNIKTSASVANAECLEWYREWARTH
ncbi:acetoacetyl- synthase protein [Rutstroemia sp. NJR-2017a BBW]|nr:acetoacetyl- synthase protein [Rutstroemia sp. NJR-2017a BBW]